MKTRTSPARLRLVFAALSAFLLVHPTNSHARIGETLGQCTTRYGAPFKVLKGGLHMFTKEPMNLGCRFSGGVCESVIICHTTRDVLNTATELSEAEIEALLEANSMGKTWRKNEVISMNRQWITTDGSLVAIYSMDHYLIIATKESMNRDAAAQAAAEKAKLKGF